MQVVLSPKVAELAKKVAEIEQRSPTKTVNRFLEIVLADEVWKHEHPKEFMKGLRRIGAIID